MTRRGWWVALAAVVVAGLVVGVVRLMSSDPRDPPFFGINVPEADGHAVATLAGEVGCRPSVMNAFVKLDSDLTTGEVDGLAADGRTPMISLEPWSWQSEHGTTDLPEYSLASIVDGDHDDAFRSIARTLGQHHGDVLVRFAHEMNADWYPWGVATNGNTPEQYVEAWRHVHDVMTEEADNLRWVWAPARTWWEDPLPLAEVYPGDDVVDYVAVSGYGHSGTAEDTYGDWYDEVRDLTDKPAILSEIGADGDDKDDWIASLADFVEERPDIVGFVWFNTAPESTGATGDYRVDDTAAHLSSFRGALRDMDVPCTTSSPGGPS